MLEFVEILDAKIVNTTDISVSNNASSFGDGWRRSSIEYSSCSLVSFHSIRLQMVWFINVMVSNHTMKQTLVLGYLPFHTGLSHPAR